MAAGKGGLKGYQVGYTKGLIHPNSGHRPLEAFWGQASYSQGNSSWTEGALVPTSGSMQTFLLLGWPSNLTFHSAHVGVLGQTPDPPALIDTLGGRPVGIAHQPACTFMNNYRQVVSQQMPCAQEGETFSPFQTDVNKNRPDPQSCSRLQGPYPNP